MEICISQQSSHDEGVVPLKKIIEDVKSSKFYAVEADEVTDTSNWEQLGVVLRYIQKDEAKERLIAFTECEGIRGEYLFRSLVDVLSSAG